MTTILQMSFVKDLANKKIIVHRSFNAPLDLVWKAWTDSEVRDKWWMPKPWLAKTKTHRFEVGGKWHYAAIGPDGTTMWSIEEYTAIDNLHSYESICTFCDEEENKNPNFASNTWKVVFIADGETTRVEVELNYPTEAAMKKMIEMGFEGGFKMALGNLDELLASGKSVY